MSDLGPPALLSENVLGPPLSPGLFAMPARTPLALPSPPPPGPSPEAAFPPPCAKAACLEGSWVHNFQLLVPIVWKRSRFSWEGSPVSVSLLGVFLGRACLGPFW